MYKMKVHYHRTSSDARIQLMRIPEDEKGAFTLAELRVPMSIIVLPRRHFHSGFSLIELLVVMTIMATLMGFTVPALVTISSSGHLNDAGSRTETLLTLARQNSISRGALTAVILLMDQGGSENAYRTLTAFELTPKENGSTPATTDWRQVWKWETFPDGVLADTTDSTFLVPPAVLTPALPTIKFKGKDYGPGTDYAYQIFTPSGGLLDTSPSCILKLKPGFYTGSAPVYTQVSNYFSFTLNHVNGQTKITRP